MNKIPARLRTWDNGNKGPKANSAGRTAIGMVMIDNNKGRYVGDDAKMMKGFQHAQNCMENRD
jgi:hypothetical protein